MANPMLDYAIVGCEVSLLGLVALVFLRSAPARWRYRLAVATFLVSVAPLSMIPSLTVSASSNAMLVEAIGVVPPIPVNALADFGPSSRLAGSMFLWTIVVFVGVGVVAYLAMAWRQNIRLRWWRRVSWSGDHLLTHAANRGRIARAAPRCEVRILPDSDLAVTTPSCAFFGLPGWSSTLWIGERLAEDPRVATVLVHELVHVRRWDPQAEMLMTMCRCLLWWHPLAWLWSYIGRREMELACDEECAALLGREVYRDTLATLIRDLSRGTGVAMMWLGSFNLRRARNLMKPKTAKKRHWLVAVATAILVPVLGIDVTAEHPPNPYSRFLSDGVRFVEDERGQRIEIHFDMPGLEAIRHLALTDGRRFLIHSDATVGRAQIDASGTRDEVIEMVAEHLGFATRIGPNRVLMAPADQFDDEGWLASAITLPPMPDGPQTRLDIELRVDGQDTTALSGLLLNESDWAGFESRGHRFNLMPEDIGEHGVDLALIVYLADEPVLNAYRRLPFAEQRSWNVGYHDPRARPRSISLRLTAYAVTAHSYEAERE